MGATTSQMYIFINLWCKRHIHKVSFPLFSHIGNHILCKPTTYVIEKYVGCSYSIEPYLFPRKQMKRGRFPSVEGWRGHSCATLNFFPRIERVSRFRWAYEWGRVAHCRRIQFEFEFQWNDGIVEQRYRIKFCQKLGDTQAETIRKMLSGIIPWAFRR